MLHRILVAILFAAALPACSSDQTSGQTSNLGTSDDPVDEGPIVNDLACDASLEGTSQCGDDTTLVYCSQGEWWGIDCTAEGAQECIDDGFLVDCVIEN